MNSQGKESLSPETFVDYQTNSLHLDPAVVDRFKMLNLRQAAPNSAAARRFKRLKRCRTCGLLKKISLLSYQESSTMKASGATDSSRRTRVCNCNPPEITSYQDLSNTAEALNQVSNSPMPEGFKNSDNPPGSHSHVSSIAPAPSPSPSPSPSIPTVPQPLFRSFSDPISPVHQQVEFTTPPRPGPLLRSRSSDQETPNSKKLRKLNEKMEDLWQWMGKVVQEEDEDATHLQNIDTINNKCKEQAEPESKNQETVCVTKTEEGLTLLFKCPCGGGYEVFLSGDKCYYRLT